MSTLPVLRSITNPEDELLKMPPISPVMDGVGFVSLTQNTELEKLKLASSRLAIVIV